MDQAELEIGARYVRKSKYNKCQTLPYKQRKGIVNKSNNWLARIMVSKYIVIRFC